MSATEKRKASQALNTTIMAFSSQWSQEVPEEAGGLHLPQSSRILSASRARSCNGMDNNGSLMSSKTTFNRRLQLDLWHTARRLLHDVAQTDSFRAIFAHMIFALIQKPLDEREESLLSHYNNAHSETSITSLRYDRWTSPVSTPVNTRVAASTVLEDLIELQGPPLSLEVALRHLFSWRTRVERHRQPGSDFGSGIGHGLSGTLHLGGFNLLFWLGVMCDTTSAALHQRPLVISDEDSDIIVTDSNIFPTTVDLQTSDTASKGSGEDKDLWGTYLLDRKCSGFHPVPRWPCVLDTAAATLSEATPLKVLLYRKIARLQTLLYRRVAPMRIENGIDSALMVYHKWNTTYGEFMTGCVTHYDAMSPRIQSWFVILSCHWYLACLLFADIIDTIDQENRGMDMQTVDRLICGTTTTIRRENALAISAVITASSLNPKRPSFGNTEFHFAISSATLLSEPWTEILMRSFTKAAGTLLELIKHYSSTTCHLPFAADPAGPADPKIWELQQGASACISGLKILARKSEIAEIVAGVLEQDLQSCWTSVFDSRDIAAMDRLVEDMVESRFSYINEISTYISLDTDASL